MSDIKDFVIEDGVLEEYTGNDAEVVIPEGVTSIGVGAFENCTNFTSIVIPKGVTSIGYGAFNGCTNLSAITIPDSVTSIGWYAFDWCRNLTTITIPKGVRSIGDNTFHNCKKLTSITIPDDVTSIGWYAFSGCKKLVTITIPESVTSIGDGAFDGCNKLRVVNLPQNITSFKGSSLEVIWDALSKTELKEVVLNSFITQLPIDLLKDADLSKKIKSNKKFIIDNIMKNDDVEILEKFFGLYKKVKLEELNEYIEKAKDSVSVLAFLLDYKNKNYTVEKQEKHENDKLDKELGFKGRTLAEWKKIYSFDVNGDEATITGYKGVDLNVIIPSNIAKYKVVAIADYAFSTAVKGIRKDIKETRGKIESIVILESVACIGNYAFSGCENLTTITIPDSVTSIGEYSFFKCTNLTTITIPESVTSIGDRAFSWCKNLTTITIPDSVTSIGDSAFSWCENLTAITIPDSVTSIGESAFSWCKNLTTITIPDSVTSIGKDAFYNCEKLTIHAYAGSYAEKYAKENKINFVAE